MRAVLLVLFVACAPEPVAVAPVPPVPPTVDTSDPPPIVKKSTPEAAANQLVAALSPCDKSAALAQCVGFDEAATLSQKVRDKAAYEAKIAEFVDKSCKELGSGTGRVVGTKVESTKTVSMKDHPELKRDLDIAMVKITVEENGATHEAPTTLMFVHLETSWKLLIN